MTGYTPSPAETRVELSEILKRCRAQSAPGPHRFVDSQRSLDVIHGNSCVPHGQVHGNDAVELLLLELFQLQVQCTQLTFNV